MMKKITIMMPIIIMIIFRTVLMILLEILITETIVVVVAHLSTHKTYGVYLNQLLDILVRLSNRYTGTNEESPLQVDSGQAITGQCPHKATQKTSEHGNIRPAE